MRPNVTRNSSHTDVVSRALELLDSVKRSYGVHSALLCINSLISTSSNSTPDPNLTAFSTPNPNHPAPPPSSEKPTKLKRRSERKDVVNTDPNFVFPDEAPDLPGLEPVTSPSARPTPSQHSSSSSIPTTTEEKPVAGRIRSLDGYWSPYAHEWRDRLSPFSPSDADEDEKSAGARSVVAEELGALMSETDVKMLRLFLREFTVQSLVPHMERSVQQWNEGVRPSALLLPRLLTGLWTSDRGIEARVDRQALQRGEEVLWRVGLFFPRRFAAGGKWQPCGVQPDQRLVRCFCASQAGSRSVLRCSHGAQLSRLKCRGPDEKISRLGLHVARLPLCGTDVRIGKKGLCERQSVVVLRFRNGPPFSVVCSRAPLTVSRNRGWSGCAI